MHQYESYYDYVDSDDDYLEEDDLVEDDVGNYYPDSTVGIPGLPFDYLCYGNKWESCNGYYDRYKEFGGVTVRFGDRVMTANEAVKHGLLTCETVDYWCLLLSRSDSIYGDERIHIDSLGNVSGYIRIPHWFKPRIGFNIKSVGLLLRRLRYRIGT